MTGSLTTNLGQNPYWDDFESNNNFYQVLFKPSSVVQARELNEIQSLFADQIAKFGDNIFTAGTVITGCNINYDKYLAYAKLNDNYANGAALTVTDLIGATAVSNSGLQAYIKNAQQGFLSDAPNLNTIFIKYLNSTTNSVTDTVIKVFQNDEVLTVFNAANVAIGQVVMANSISSGNSSQPPTGTGYALTIGDGVIYQKGLFLDVDQQTLIVNAYNSFPDNISVGFSSIESIITAYQDPNLNDNAQGSPNYAAPGADRLQITPTLVAVNTNSISPNSFFSIVDFVAGSPSLVNIDTSYSDIGKYIAEVSNDTNGSFIVNPFAIRVTQANTSNSQFNEDFLKVEIDPGEAYINGNRINLIGKLIGATPTGSTIGQANQQILTTTLGNYVTVQDVVGSFDPTKIETVYLYGSNNYAVSNNITKGVAASQMSVAGTKLGTASLLQFQYVSGTRDQKNCQYNAYLTNIQMTGNNAFNSVASIFANTENQAFADIVQSVAGTNTALQAANSGQLIYGINNPAIATLKTSSNTIDTQFEFVTSTSVTIPSTGSVTITVPSYTGGINQLPYGTGPLTLTELPGILVVAEGNSACANIGGSVVVTTASNVVTGTSTNFSANLYVGCLIGIVNATATEYAEVATIVNATSLTTTNPITTGTTANVYVAFLNGMYIPLEAMGANVNIINSTSFSVNLATTMTTSLNANVFYNVQRTGASPRKKDLQTQVWAQINCASHPNGATGPWCLGFPDVFQIENVYIGSTFSNTNPTTTAYVLNNGQSDTAYNLSYLTSAGMGATTSSRIMIEFSCFLPDVSQGVGFYSVDSYPVDDTGLTANSIYTRDIPAYFSVAGQNTYDLRNSIDFRIYAANTIAVVNNYASAVGNASITNPSATVTYSGANILIPTVNEEFETSYQFYMGRYDTLGISNTGTMIVNQGVPSTAPIPLGQIPNGMTLANIYIPPYPSVTPDVVDSNMRTNYPRASISYLGNRRYTMADIGTLDKRLQQVEYYTSLSLLEQSAQNLLLTNANGVTRFNNGMLADPMQDFSIANTMDPSFNIAIDSANSWARPTFTQQNIKLKLNTSQSNNLAVGNTITANGRLVYLTDTSVGPFSYQLAASQYRNCAQDTMYTWSGTMECFPDGDYAPDVTVNPTVVADINNYSNFVNLVNGWNTQWGTWNETNVSVSSNGSALSATTTTTTTSATIGISAQTTTQNLGTYVTSVELQPYCRANLIQIYAYGLKPSTQFYFFVNDVPQTLQCYSATIQNNVYTSWTPEKYNYLVSDEYGQVLLWYYLPASTFNSGALNFQLLDIPDLATGSQAISSLCSATYYGTNLAYSENNLELETTEPQFTFNSVSSTVSSTVTAQLQQTITNNNTTYNDVYNNLYNKVNTTAGGSYSLPTVSGPAHSYDAGPAGASASGVGGANAGGAASTGDASDTGGASEAGGGGGGAGGGDPIAQSLRVFASAVPASTQCVYATSVSVYFEAKDPKLGVTLYMVPLIGGFPATGILPFSSTHLTSAQVSVSNNASVATTFNFSAPVLLEVGQDYAFVVAPDGSNPNYNIWTGVISQKDVISGAPIYSLASTGEMFLSSQAVTWTPYQNESLKYSMNIANFPDASGYAIFNNDDSEYLKIANNFGFPSLGTLVLFGNMSNDVIGTIGGQAQTTLNSNTVIVGSTTGLVNGISTVIVTSTTQQQAFGAQVANVINSTSLTLTKALPWTDNTTATAYNVTHNPSGVVGVVNTTFMAVANSTANTAAYLSNNYSYMIYTAFPGNNAGTFCQSTALIDLPYDSFMGKFSTSVPSLTSLNFTMSGVSNGAGSYANDASITSLPFGQSIDFLDKARVIMSKSKEMQYRAGAKSLTINASMYTLSTLETPIIDMVKAGALLIHNTVNPEVANSTANTIYLSEVSNFGNAENKYISTTVTLANSIVADDLNVYVGAFYPANTEVYVYGKVVNQYDPTPWTTQIWSPMITTNLSQSSKLNVYDFNEYLFTFANTAPANGCAYYDQSNGGILTYVSNNTGQKYAGYNTFAIKIVLLADASMNVPFITDMRAIALS